jgi:hypothetical protein
MFHLSSLTGFSVLSSCIWLGKNTSFHVYAQLFMWLGECFVVHKGGIATLQIYNILYVYADENNV